MRRLITAALAAGLVLVPGTAWADRGGYDDECRGGGCGNEREENYEGAGCKYVCPSFDKSPVQDAFNISPTICMPMSTCHFDGSQEEGGQGEGGDQPAQPQ